MCVISMKHLFLNQILGKGIIVFFCAIFRCKNISCQKSVWLKTMNGLIIIEHVQMLTIGLRLGVGGMPVSSPSRGSHPASKWILQFRHYDEEHTRFADHAQNVFCATTVCLNILALPASICVLCVKQSQPFVLKIKISHT